MLLVAAGTLLVLSFDVGRVLGGEGVLRFWDQDSYTRLLRLRELLRGGGWYDATLDAINAPFGLPMHWTRLLDVLLAPAALLLTPWLGETAALEWAGAMAGPLLAVVALLVLWSALPPGADRRVLALSGALFVLQRPVAYRFAFAQADHHHLIVLLHLATLAPLLRLPYSAAPGRLGLLAGIAAALGLWVTPGAVITLAIAVLVLAVAWLGDGDARAMRRFGEGLLATALLALLLERAPSQWTVVEYDRFSLVHVTLAAGIFVSGWLLSLLGGLSAVRASWQVRGVLAALVAALGGGLLLVAFPYLANSPLALVDTALARSLEQGISELRPSLPRNWQAVPEFVLDMAPALVALLWSVLRVRATRDAERRRALSESMMLAVLMVVAMYLTRAQELLLALAPLAWAQAMVRLADGAAEGWRERAVARALGSTVLVLTLAAATWTSGYAWAALGGWDVRKPAGCEYDRVAGAISAATTAGETVLADMNAGPEVAWRSERGVLAALYHRNAAGIRAASAMYFSTGDDAIAREVVRERRIGALVLCRRLSRADVRTLRARPDILFSRVQTSRAPAWMQPLPLPPALAGQFALYRITPAP